MPEPSRYRELYTELTDNEVIVEQQVEEPGHDPLDEDDDVGRYVRESVQENGLSDVIDEPDVD